MPLPFSIEELVVDDSFISYCFNKEEEDIAFWRAYLKAYPDEEAVVSEAKALVLKLRVMLNHEQDQLAPIGHLSNTLYVPHADDYTKEEMVIEPPKKYGKKIIWSVAASLVAITLSVFWLYDKPATASIEKRNESITSASLSHFSTEKGERKEVYLPDSTRVLLNGGSVLSLAAGFGQENRWVNLSGEAFFEVKRDETLPFLVKTKKYAIRVLGTVFNVKDYPGDKQSETSLISGKVEIFMKEDSAHYLFKVLQPEQKFVLYNKESHASDVDVSVSEKDTKIVGLTYTDANENIETGWVQNRLIIENDRFDVIADKLERWYNVKLIFNDEKVKSYRYTGTFENDSLEMVMKAFQASYFFNYNITDKGVEISK